MAKGKNRNIKKLKWAVKKANHGKKPNCRRGGK
jgi:hypothetical protein